MWFYVFIAWVVMVAGIFWAYRRKRNQTSGARAKQLDALISEMKATAPVVESALPVTPAAPAARSVATVPATAYTRKARLLDKNDALLYLLLRTGLPDHEIFARLTLAELVEPAATLRGFEREQSMRRLAQSTLEFVVSNKQLEVVAAVIRKSVDAGEMERQRVVQSTLAAAGIRVVTVDTDAMPRHHQVKALVYGETPPEAG